MPQHPEPHVRRAVRLLAMVGELHRRGYQKLRVMPFMSPSGNHWRCWIGPDTLFYRDHGAYLRDFGFSETQRDSSSARYTSGEEARYFGWTDAERDDARSLADKFVGRFVRLAGEGKGWSYTYAGWYQRLLGLAERGWLPVVMHDGPSSSLKKINLSDLRPAEWRTEGEQQPSLPLPPAGKSSENLR
ncbi:hypothetical protein LRP30_40540 [Bradyrhizobium sp. C-145]|uniref:hypothetical protein n=1 Tax=Bradyrhizobium sp. C-145 TaxID=574727 RepID=UPI00201B6596|nr:hypothetical protein [Bradyrhizobium sp. C-145]UQR62959.1 hypothetical protein LRP30_40540 [Bradyrhizobium sp. C-145]